MNRGRISAFTVSVFVALADQATKAAAQSCLMKGISEDVIGSVLRFTLRYNYGAAFSLGWGGPLFLTVFTALACVFLARYMFRTETGSGLIWLGVVLGGALGNLTDRILMGKVTDFIDVGLAGWRWPTFNVADIAICIGGIAVFLVYRKTRRLEASSEEEK
jgi:signal peptidase II